MGHHPFGQQLTHQPARPTETTAGPADIKRAGVIARSTIHAATVPIDQISS